MKHRKQVGDVKFFAARFLLISCLLFNADAPLVSQEPSPKPTESERIDDRATRIKSLVQKLGTEYKMPNMFAGYQTLGGPFIGYAGGRRKLKSKVRVTLEDKVHLGSCGKAMTATMIARLIERGQLKHGKLTWELSVKEGLPELANQIDESYHDVTIRQLLMHRGGCPGDTNWLLKGKSITDTRRLLVKRHLSKTYENEPGEFCYSNLGYVLASLMATRATGKTWEVLMKEEIFQPLKLTTAGFGPPGTEGKEDQPWGHVTVGSLQIPVQADNQPALGPAGTVHMSLSDWARFCLSHTLDKNKDWTKVQKDMAAKLRLLSDESLRELHGLPNGVTGDGNDYALGWVVRRRFGVPTISHAGSNTMWIAVTVTCPEENTVFLTATSVANENVGEGLDKVFEPMFKIYRESGRTDR